MYQGRKGTGLHRCRIQAGQRRGLGEANIIVFNYGLLHIRDRKKETDEYVTKATEKYNDYLDLHSQIWAKLAERSSLQKELDSLGVFSIGRRKKLKTRIAELSEEIEETRFEEGSIIQDFGKEDAAGMKEVKTDISEAEADMAKLGKQETTLADAIDREKERFTGLKEQAAELDRAELTDARLALRPQMETQAQKRIRDAVSSGRVNLWDFQASVSETDSLLGEEGMAEQHEREKRLKEYEMPNEPNRKPKSHDWER